MNKDIKSIVTKEQFENVEYRLEDQMSSKHKDREEFEKLKFGDESVKVKIPKFTDVLIVTTISQAVNGGTNISTYSYSSEEIENMKEK